MNKDLIIIFTRNPELGKVKTRLAKTVGNETALNIYKFLLQHTVKITEKLKADKVVYYSERISQDDLWDKTVYTKALQQGGDLGIRMENAFKHAFKMQYERVLIIGSDLYDINETIINKAFDQLNTKDLVFGPAEDGGFYLMGMKKFYPEAFKKKAWGTSSVLKDTLNDLNDFSIAIMSEVLNDIDIYEDIAHKEVFKPFLKNASV